MNGLSFAFETPRWELILQALPNGGSYPAAQFLTLMESEDDAAMDEALELRRGGITMPILILGHTPVEYTSVLLENRLTSIFMPFRTVSRFLSAFLKSLQLFFNSSAICLLMLDFTTSP